MVERLTDAQVETYKPNLTVAAPETLSSGLARNSQWPVTYKQLVSAATAAGGGEIIGIMTNFALNRYFFVRSQADVDQLIGGCMNGGSMTVQWRYVKVDLEDSCTVHYL